MVILKRNHFVEDDYSDLMQLLGVLNVDEWVSNGRPWRASRKTSHNRNKNAFCPSPMVPKMKPEHEHQSTSNDT